MSLPKQIIPIKNPDKLFHEKWTKKRDMLNIPSPARILLFGKPNVGKTTIIKNILLRAKPPYEEIIICHPDAEYTQEWNDIDATIINQIPAPPEWSGNNVKTLCIIDDMEFKTMDKEQKYNLDRLFGYVSTHKNVNVMLASQNFFNPPPIVRRCCNMFILWNNHDYNSMAQTAGKTGLTAKQLQALFKIVGDGRNSLWLDLTSGSPYKIRKNGYELIQSK